MARGRRLTATATETTIMAPEIATGGLGIMSLNEASNSQSEKK